MSFHNVPSVSGSGERRDSLAHLRHVRAEIKSLTPEKALAEYNLVLAQGSDFGNPNDMDNDPRLRFLEQRIQEIKRGGYN